MLNYLLKDEGSTFIFTSGNDEERYVSSEELYKTAKNTTKNNKLYKMNLQEAILYAKKQENKVSFAIGSFYIYEDVKNILEIQ